MDDDAHLTIGETLRLPRAELTYRATRGGGPGGQHVNTSATRVELTWDVAGSPSLSDEQRARLLDKLATRLDGSGVLRLTEGGSRSRHQNTEAVTARLVEVVERALRRPRPRRKTKVPRAAREARLRAKKKRAEVKKLRNPPRREEWGDRGRPRATRAPCAPA